MSIQSVNPATGELITTYEAFTHSELEAIVVAADRASVEWRHTSFDRRGQVLEAVAVLLDERVDALAGLMAREMGKPLADGRAEVEKCAWVCRYYATHGAQHLGPIEIPTEAAYSGVVFEPLGVVLAVMPWNFPLWQAFRAAAPTLCAGNTMLLKHASNVTGCGLAIESLFRDAGAPPGVFRTVILPSERIADLIAAPEIRAVTLTGSTSAGRAVAAAAGKHLKPCLLELGGSDPYIVLEDADLELAAAKCAKSRLINSGQSCIAAKRFVVVDKVRAEFTERLVAEMKTAVLGDPFADDTTVGPQAREDLRADLHRQVTRSIEAGATCLLGGVVEGGDGAYYPPTVLTDVGPSAAAYKEEIFGPVAAIIAADDAANAIQIANDSSFGLGAAVFTRDVERGRRIAESQLRAGSCAVNDFVRSHPHLPFGGIKDSGFGRELGEPGIRAFVNAKTIYVAK